MHHYWIKYCLAFLILKLVSIGVKAQAVYEPVDNNPIYELLDELASLKVITINSVVKPYTRVFIANKLKQAIQNAEKLNRRQLGEVEFYLKDYSFELNSETCLPAGRWRNSEIKKSKSSEIDTSSSSRNQVFSSNPIAVSYSGNVFKLRATPWLGGRFMVNENGNFKEFSGGGEVFGYLGKHIGYYANVKYVWESEPLVNPMMFSLEEGKSWNYLGNGSVENTEWRGGISAGWNWGEFGIFKDRPVWGNAIHGTNIMSGHPPSFPYIQLHLKPAKWIEFYSITGALQSNVIDSSRSTFEPGLEHLAYHRKYMSANFFTITLWKGLDISLGNSIFWSDVFKVGYLIPFNLYKSMDESLKGSFAYTGGNVNTNDDGHLFLDISSRNIKHLHLYLGFWIDDWVSSYLLDSKLHNAFGWKLGMTLYDLPLNNLSLTIEGSINRPRIYQEYIPANTYGNDDYNFGNYLRDDSWELYFCATYKPIRGMSISASYNIAQRGGFLYMVDDYTTYPISKNLIFNEHTFEFNFKYQVFSNVQVFLGYKNQQHAGDIQYIPVLSHGNTNTIDLGVNIGF